MLKLNCDTNLVRRNPVRNSIHFTIQPNMSSPEQGGTIKSANDSIAALQKEYAELLKKTEAGFETLGLKFSDEYELKLCKHVICNNFCLYVLLW